MNKIMNHIEYPKRLKTKTDAELLFTIKDATEAMQAMPDNPNNGYYADECCYCGMELQYRARMRESGIKNRQRGRK